MIPFCHCEPGLGISRFHTFEIASALHSSQWLAAQPLAEALLNLKRNLKTTLDRLRNAGGFNGVPNLENGRYFPLQVKVNSIIGFHSQGKDHGVSFKEFRIEARAKDFHPFFGDRLNLRARLQSNAGRNQPINAPPIDSWAHSRPRSGAAFPEW